MDGKRSALIIAGDDYTDPGLRRLRAPAADAQALAQVLEHPGIGGFQVRTLLNQPSHEVNLAVEEFFADRRPDDLLLLHVSCHGVKDEDGELYFAATNTRLRRLGSTAVAAEFVNRRMSRSRSRRVVLLLDCCYAGAFERGMTARAGSGVGIEEQFGGRGRAVITASSAMEYAFEGDQLADTTELSPSVFTSALVEGLETGEADRDQDGLVGLDELYDYIYDKVRAATPNQTPGKWAYGVQGDLYIARRARPVTTPAPLPPELQQAVDHPLTAVRAGAVQELARLLESSHAGLALAARLTLERLGNDDSRIVSAAATAALGAPAQPAAPAQSLPPKLELSDTVIDFGQLAQHSQSPKRQVRLSNSGGGVLNARAATSANWLQLHQAEGELVLRIDTTVVGDHEGTITVDSDGGSATIRVHARIAPKPLLAAEPTATTPTTTSGFPPRTSAGGTVNEPAARSTPPPSQRATRTPSPTIGIGPSPEAKSVPPQEYSIDSPAPARNQPSTQHAADIGRAVAQSRGDRQLRVAGSLAIVGAALLVVSLLPIYGDRHYRHPWSPVWWSMLILAFLALSGGICVLVPRMGRMIGPGVLLGVAAAVSWGLLVDAQTYLLFGFGSLVIIWGVSWVLGLIAEVILVVAGCLAGVGLARTGDIRVVLRLPTDPLAWFVVLLGVAGAVAWFLYTSKFGSERWSWIPRMWVTAMAVLVPATAAVAVPRRFGGVLLAGWIGGAAALALGHFLADPAGRGQLLPFVSTLFVLLLVTVPFARTASTSQVERTP